MGVMAVDGSGGGGCFVDGGRHGVGEPAAAGCDWWVACEAGRDGS